MLALAISCSKDDDGDVLGGNEEPVPAEVVTPIVFSAMQQEEQTVTRSDAPLSTVANTFTVYGYKNMSAEGSNYGDEKLVFPGYTVKWTENSAATTTTNTNGWDYVNQISSTGDEQTIKYWDWSAKAYRFFGVTEAENVIGEIVGDGSDKAYEITMTADASSDAGIAETPYYSHLWFSNGAYPNKPFGQPVQLEYLKPLAKVRFKFIFEDPDDAPRTTLTDKIFCPTSGDVILTKAQITVSYPLTGSAVKESFAITSKLGSIPAFKDDYYEEEEVQKDGEGKHVIYPYYDAVATAFNKEYTVLPATNQGTYTLTVSINGEPKTTVVPSEYMDWKIGYLYTYIFKVHVDLGVSIDVVQSAFTTWNDVETGHTVYNW